MEVTLAELNIDAEEGDALQVCASVNTVYPMRERDVILEFTLTSYSQFASKSNCVFLEQLVIIAWLFTGFHDNNYAA